MTLLNVSPLVIQKQHFGITIDVYYCNQNIVSVIIPRDTLFLVQGVNTGKVVDLKTHPETMDVLMEFIGKYSEGEEAIDVVVKNIKGVYRGEGIEWLDEILVGTVLNFTLPAGKEGFLGTSRKLVAMWIAWIYYITFESFRLTVYYLLNSKLYSYILNFIP